VRTPRSSAPRLLKSPAARIWFHTAAAHTADIGSQDARTMPTRASMDPNPLHTDRWWHAPSRSVLSCAQSRRQHAPHNLFAAALQRCRAASCSETRWRPLRRVQTAGWFAPIPATTAHAHWSGTSGVRGGSGGRSTPSSGKRGSRAGRTHSVRKCAT
jgi:uncharacterized membrane protein YgcG